MYRPTHGIFYDAGTLVVICRKPLGPYAEADCWLAAQNLMLATCDKHFGTCCIGFAVPAANCNFVSAGAAGCAHCCKTRRHVAHDIGRGTGGSLECYDRQPLGCGDRFGGGDLT